MRNIQNINIRYGSGVPVPCDPGVPVPCDPKNVTYGCHVAIIGDITIGNNVTIGAGAVVVKDVPDNTAVVGNPASIIKYNKKILSK